MIKITKTTTILIIILSIITITSCKEEITLVGKSGRSLEILVDKPIKLENLDFVHLNGQYNRLFPKASNRILALVEVTVINRTSTVVPLKIDEDSSTLGDSRGEILKPLNPFKNNQLINIPNEPIKDIYSPLLWGEIELARNTEVSGWMVFDVPRGLRLNSFTWDEVDYIITGLIE
ncbi:MAG: hypothetical protein CL758_06675 [Chloroflexi bacterium]|nr:hypothetical protein [Chloroflexota bacterium]|tara:strand:+ start:1381 stop:1908 length:528 start_codon:yes stop_codon:yes gene_type:complete